MPDSLYTPEPLGNLRLIKSEVLMQANIGNHSRLIIKEGEILIKSAKVDAQKLLDELEGCLGEENSRNV